MLYLLNPKVWIAAAIVAALGFSHFFTYRAGANNVRVQWQSATAAANQEAVRLERARQRNVDDAARAAAARESRLRADSRRAAGESAGLRDDLRSAGDYAAQSKSAADETIRVTTGLFERCTSLYLGVAEEAARADLEARELRQAWPR
jgi:hypothetical protein